MAIVAKVKPKPKEVAHPDAFGLKELVPGINPIIDIVAIHGLNGHRENSFTAENGVNWLKDLLPDKTPNARIFSYGYDSRILGDVSRQHLHNHGMALVTDLSLTRRSTQTEGRPIIFIAHSLGGIICKSGLIHASMTNEAHLPRHKDIHVSTYGIMFFGTPHQGGNGVSLARSLMDIASVFMIKTNQGLLKHLEKNSEMLEKLTQEFNSISSQFDTKFLYETYETPTPLGLKLLVPKYSAVVPGAINAEEIAINRNHREMVKFVSTEDEAFRKVYLSINIMLTSALPHIAQSQRRHSTSQQELEQFESLR